MGNRTDRRAILARANAATPGPWLSDPTGTVCAASDVVPDGEGGEILPPDGPMEVTECYRSVLPDERANNAAFIAAARTDVPALVGDVDERDELIRVLFAVYETWEHRIGTFEPLPEQIAAGIASLVTIEDSHAMDAVTDAVVPHEPRIRELLGGDTNE